MFFWLKEINVLNNIFKVLLMDNGMFVASVGGEAGGVFGEVKAFLDGTGNNYEAYHG